MSIDLARRAACALLVGVLDEGQTLAEQAEVFDGLSPPERARAQRLALSVLRNLARADAMLKPHLRKAPPADLMVLLRLGTVELCEGAPPHGVVNAVATLARSGGRRTEGFTGLVNAVLRKVSEDVARWQTLPAPALPGWLRGRMMSAWGKAAVQRIEAAHLAGAPLDLTLKGAPSEELVGGLGGEMLPTGSLRLPSGAQVTDLPGYSEGEWWVQDAAAALAARVLAAQPGERVLDLCAAPGGKTMQLAAAGARVTALDISESRLARLRENLSRCRLEAEVVAADAMLWAPDAPFDAILLDAPCSATGTIRRHPDLPHVKSSAAIRDLVALQSALIDRALGWLRPGGRLVYVTCSLLPEEGEHQIAAAAARHGLRIAVPEVAGMEPGWAVAEGLRLRPDYWLERGGMDGFFIGSVYRDS